MRVAFYPRLARVGRGRRTRRDPVCARRAFGGSGGPALPILVALIAVQSCFGPAVRAAAEGKPNLVLIFADDFGYGDPGCYGGTLVPTPALDSLARDGVRCTDGYVTAPVCAPSRCGLMTGSYNQRFGIQWNEDRAKYGIGTHKLLPQALKAAGYVTGHIGKWNIGADIKGCFDEVYDLIDWEADYFPDANGHYFGVDSGTEHASGKVQGVWGPARDGEEYLTDRIGRHAVEFVGKHKGRPFFLYLAFNAVHSPWHAKASVRGTYAGIKPEPIDYYAAMVASMDENIGRVLAKLKELGLDQNTLVAFVSDNGPAMGSPRIKGWPAGWTNEVLVGSAGPLRGYKGQFYEGGIREPFLLRWPERLKAGSEYRRPVSAMDLYATFCAAAGAPVPDGTRLDGVNLLPFLRGEKTGAPHDILFWKNGEQGAVREGDWKLLLSPFAPKVQLFNLAADVGEKRDRSASEPDRVARLHKAWMEWGAAMPPRANPPTARVSPGAAGKGAPTADRGALFAAKDKDGDGRLSHDEFTANQADPENAKKRFGTWDANRDGFLGREEFVNMGGRGK